MLLKDGGKIIRVVKAAVIGYLAYGNIGVHKLSLCFLDSDDG